MPASRARRAPRRGGVRGAVPRPWHRARGRHAFHVDVRRRSVDGVDARRRVRRVARNGVTPKTKRRGNTKNEASRVADAMGDARWRGGDARWRRAVARDAVARDAVARDAVKGDARPTADGARPTLIADVSARRREDEVTRGA